jgi:parallel beta-helix repeat protein
VKNANRGTQFLTGMDNYGGGFLINNFNKVRIQHCSITYCKAFDGGAGICIYNSSNISILDNYIAYNNALDASSSVNDGGGILCKGGSSPIISRNEISYNSAAGHGSAIYVSGGSPQINNNLITRNNTYPCWFTGNCNVNVVDNTFTYNNLTNGNTGAPISVNQAINVLIQNNTITNNVNSSYSGFLKGGGIYVGTATTILIKGNTIAKNSLSVSTSGYVLEGGGIYCNTTNKAYIINNFISNNTGAANGGGLYIKNGFLINNVICNNMALGGTLNDGKGGGVCVQDTVVLINNTIANNYAKKGGGVYINGRRNSKMFNCIVWGNDISTSGKGRQVYCNNAQTTFNYTILNCDIDSGQTGIGLLNNNLQGMIYQNNIDTIPGFVNPTDTAWVTADATLADWTLLGSSACINNGNSSVVTELSDILGNARIYDTNVDVGAYEYQSILTRLTPKMHIGEVNVSCYPNPASSQLNIYYLPPTNYSLTIQNALGETVFSEQNCNALETIDVSSFAEGVYFARINNVNRKFIKK